MRSGRPPTLWWDLMTALGPPAKETDSMTSGYRVPWARKSAPPAFSASSSKTSMKAAPMRLRLSSGSVTPSSAPRNRAAASRRTRGML